MARNFKIQFSGSDRTLFFDLIGDFDGSSAFELLNILQEKILTSVQHAYVNTSHLKSIHPFGRDVFARNFPNVTHAGSITFTGNHALELSPMAKTATWNRYAARTKMSYLDHLDPLRPQSGHAAAEGK